MRYCAFLRGVNTGGTTMKMAEVCKVFANGGVAEVSSVLATGNILFTSDEKVAVLKQKLEKLMSDHFGYEAFLFLKTGTEIERIFQKCPFSAHEDFHTYVFFGVDGIEKTLLHEFGLAKKSEGEKAEIANGTFYWQVKKGNTLDSDFGKILGKKSLKSKITSRNINTLQKIIGKL